MSLIGKRCRRLGFGLLFSQLVVCAVFLPMFRTWISNVGFDRAVLSLNPFLFNIDDNKSINHISVFSPSAAAAVPDIHTDIGELNIPVMNTWVQYADNDTLCAAEFLPRYERYCEDLTRERNKTETLNVDNNNEPDNNNDYNDGSNNNNGNRLNVSLCPCLPTKLRGRVNISAENLTLSALEMKNWNLGAGGSWAPAWCQPRQRLAIIIPFYDRETHLSQLLQILHPMLQRQLADYTIFVVEQMEPFEMFNKGMLMNAGFIEARARGPFDCYIFHDVDMLPEDDRNMYACSKSPRHLGAYIKKYAYGLGYGETIGGVAAYTRRHFERVNGFSNECYGWGGEDDDMSFRIHARGLTYVRFPRCISQYDMAYHEHGSDKRNPYGPCRLEYSERLQRPPVYDTVGLNNVKYRLISVRTLPLYTWLYVYVPPMPPKTTTTTTETTPTVEVSNNSSS